MRTRREQFDAIGARMRASFAKRPEPPSLEGPLTFEHLVKTRDFIYAYDEWAREHDQLLETVIADEITH